MPIFRGVRQNSLPLEKTKKAITQRKHPDAYLIQSAATLLANEKRQQHIKNIKSLLHLPPKLYNSLYYQVIEQFAEFVQNLPETAYGIFSGEGGFLEHGLERASRALSLCLTYFFQDEKSFKNISPQQALWIYAVFTAALLQDIGKLAVKYKITFCQKDGTEIQTWSSYTCSMVAQSKYYKYEFVKENREHLRRQVTPLLARQILDNAIDISKDNTNTMLGFNWITSDPDVLESWLSLLSGETRLPMSSFMTMIPLADIQVIENHIKNGKLPNSGQPGGMFIGLPQSITDDAMFTSTLATGEAFFEWLHNGISNGTISVNQAKSNIHTTPEGYLMILPDTYKEFSIENAQYKNPEGIAQQVRKYTELFQESIANLGERYSVFGGQAKIEMDKVLVINNPAYLVAHGQQTLNILSRSSPHVVVVYTPFSPPSRATAQQTTISPQQKPNAPV